MRSAPAWIPLWLLPTAVLAADGEQSLSLTPAYAAVVMEDDNGHEVDLRGAALAVDYERGVSDTLWLRASATGGIYGASGAPWSGMGTVGITYAIDVLRYVPLVNLGVGAMIVGGDEVARSVRGVIEVGVGLDVLESRNVSWGFAARLDAFVSEVAFFTIGPRLSWRWGYF